MDVSGKGEKIQQSVVRLLEIPRDLAFDLPKITLLGNMEMCIENYNGLIEFTPEKIALSTSQGAVELSGQGLTIRSILPYEMVVEGRFQTLRFLE